ncbi:MAG: hypothetical protein HN658_02025 [Rhodospirillales bacterium]|jgi:hypothetical protein|nr:hypothetical protein [Rhodospirillales bacterium]MBT4006428.1 hypothetical protein [Rhodospirillales bacterium]MBT5075073.1 hypothetical protein [Rhodospirillales bacterium]MBT5112640.1 hypothetical protein [Rhodospirillales bacterium]MBT5673409.1 hypothetical protein [Rhodospirillales bacterium]
MFGNPSLMTRVGVGKGIGFGIGLIGFFVLPHLWPEASSHLRWGILLWYTTFGAIIGVFGIFTHHPVLKIPMPWWVRDPVLGAWLNFVLTFFAYEPMKAMLHATFGADGLFVSPYWFVAEGALIGLFIGYFATRFGGEGVKTANW